MVQMGPPTHSLREQWCLEGLRFYLVYEYIFIYIYILSFCSDKECDFRIQLPSVCDKHVKIDIDGNGKVNDFTNQ